MTIDGVKYYGRELLDHFEAYVRQSFDHKDIQDDLATDLVWYLWTGKYSSLFGKRAMTTFERYFIADKSAHKETKILTIIYVKMWICVKRCLKTLG